ncbi:SpoIIE family protein phosphatase [Streptomyces sp. NBC_01619]|uniref:ATP-binding SpoIIE family protein phosphatase n=1 Tax=Streptomyces sp. NBC_01619 TaxID=2975901 RepID=UPI00224EBF66|nr:SpoIIE family protein phosphatase [Streptomyces sp. NBC_01619]MCX4510831.1 SpoIIE family protein phosphatase [Streptomyces sp. NBC_01619]
METDQDYPFAVANTAAALLDDAGTILAWTPAAEALLERRSTDVCGRPVRDLLADASSWGAVLARRTREGWEGQATLRHGSGRDLAIGFRVLPLHDGRRESAARCLVIGAPADLIAKWRQDHAFTQELFLQGRVGLAVFDGSLRLQRTNSHLLPFTGVPVDLAGRRLDDFLRAEDARAIDERLGEVLRSGTPLIAFNVVARTLDDPRGGRELSLSAFRLQGSEGRPMGVATVFTDVTDHVRASGRLELLYRATEAMSGSLSVMRTVEDLAGLLAPAFGDCAAVDLAETVLTGGEPPADGRHTLVLLRMAVAGADSGALRTGTAHVADVPTRPAPDVDPSAPDASAQDAPAPDVDPSAPDTLAQGTSAPDVPARDGQGVLIRLDQDAPTTASGVPPDWAGAVPGAHSAMAAPLYARGTMFGRLLLWRTGSRPALDEDDLDLLEEIANRSALAVDNARRFTKERRTALGLQRSLLPPATSERPAMETAGAYLPADSDSGVGGDWFDVIPLSSARVALVVGDVAGHGLHATAMMGRLRSAVRALADLDLEPEELLVHLDDLVLQVSAEADTWEAESGDGDIPVPSGPAGATCLYVVYDPVAQQCVMASAGHPPPAVVGPDGTVEYVELSPGPPLGVGGWPFETTERDLAPGSVLALYTDGLIERGEGDIDEGMRDLADRLVRAEVLERPLRQARHDIVSDLPPGRLSDDVTLLLGRTRVVPPDATATWQLEADPALVGRARHLVLEQLSRWELDELAFTTELVASELVTNAIRYAGGPVRLRLIRTDVLTCEVSDPSNTQPRMRRARTSEEGGRGLYLVAQLSHRWGSRYTREGKTVWSEQSLPLTDRLR